MNNENKGTLFIVATPIGNLEDMTFRAIRVLQEVDLIACEDTRVTRKLLDRYEIKTPTVSYFAHSKLSKIDYLIEQLETGKSIALVSDAGTPGISDPGQYLIAQIHQCVIPAEAGIHQKKASQGMDPRVKPEDDKGGCIQIIPIPGASALSAAASVSGMIDKDFYFAGFLPKKKGRQTQFKTLAQLDVPVVIYESAMRIEKTLNDIKEYLGDGTEVFIAREITKMFEEYWGGKIDEVMQDLKNHKLKGEIVLLIKKV